MEIKEQVSNNDPSSFSLLLRDMSEYKVLSSEEQLELFREYEVTKDPKIRELVINSNLPLVLSRAKKFVFKYNKPNVLLNDIFQEGAKGLIRAFDTFDYHRGVLFSTYATTVIDGIIHKLEFSYDRTVNLPIGRRYEISALYAKETTLTMQLRRYPTIKELADYSGLSEEKVIELKNDYQEIKYLNERADNGESESCEILDLIPSEDTNYLEVEDKSINQELEKILFKSLSDRELMVIILRYGLAHEDALTMQSVANLLHCKKQRINTIEINALEKIKYYYDTGCVKRFLKNATIRDYIVSINDEELIKIINSLNENAKNLLYKRYNVNLTEIVNRDMTLEEFRYIFRVIVPKINYKIEMFKSNVRVLKR